MVIFAGSDADGGASHRVLVVCFYDVGVSDDVSLLCACEVCVSIAPLYPCHVLLFVSWIDYHFKILISVSITKKIIELIYYIRL